VSPSGGTGDGRSALIIVDVQTDFLPGGALGITDSDQILPGIERLMTSGRFPVQVATQVWYPRDHVSFASRYAGKEPFDAIALGGEAGGGNTREPRGLLPDHCVRGTAGAELAPGLPWDGVSAVIRRGMDPEVVAGSGFRDNGGPSGKRASTGLGGWLQERGVEHVVICGLARDRCVRWTAEDAADAGFHVTIRWDLTRSVDPSGDEALREELEDLNIWITRQPAT